MTLDSLIDALGGTSDVAKALSVSPPNVSNWRRRGKIPSELWSEIVRLAGLRGVNGITLELLAAMHARKADAAASAEAQP